MRLDKSLLKELAKRRKDAYGELQEVLNRRESLENGRHSIFANLGEGIKIENAINYYHGKFFMINDLYVELAERFNNVQIDVYGEEAEQEEIELL